MEPSQETVIAVTVSGPFGLGRHVPRTFRASGSDHGLAVGDAIKFLAADVLPDALALDSSGRMTVARLARTPPTTVNVHIDGTVIGTSSREFAEAIARGIALAFNGPEGTT